MSDPGGPIVVAGDATIEGFLYPVAGTDSPENRQRHDSHHFDALRGDLDLRDLAAYRAASVSQYISS